MLHLYFIFLTWYFGGFPQQWCLDVAILPGHQNERQALCVWHPEYGDSVPAGYSGVDECVVCIYFHGRMAQGLLAHCVLYLNPEDERRLWSDKHKVRDVFFFLNTYTLIKKHAVSYGSALFQP